MPETTLDQPQLGKLVSISLKKKFHPLTFGKLYKEYKFRILSGSSGAEMDLLPLFQNCSSSALQLKYIFEVLITNDLDNTFEDRSHKDVQLTGLPFHNAENIGRSNNGL